MEMFQSWPFELFIVILQMDTQIKHKRTSWLNIQCLIQHNMLALRPLRNVNDLGQG